MLIICVNRNVYYQNQELFKSQQIVDQLVDDIAVMLTVNRDDLNIVRALVSFMACIDLNRSHLLKVWLSAQCCFDFMTVLA